MKNVTAVLSVKFKSSHAPEKLMEVCQADLGTFQNVPGLIQKYYISEPESGAISGIYMFDSAESRDAFWTSDLAGIIPERYGVIMESLRVEKYDMAIVLNEAVAA